MGLLFRRNGLKGAKLSVMRISSSTCWQSLGSQRNANRPARSIPTQTSKKKSFLLNRLGVNMSNTTTPSKREDKEITKICSATTATITIAVIAIVIGASVAGITSVTFIKPKPTAPDTDSSWDDFPWNLRDYDLKQALRDIESLGPRFPGTNNSRYTVSWIEKQFENIACNVTRDDFEIPVFHIPDNATLSISSSQLTMTLQYNKDFVQSQYGGSAPVTLIDTPISRMSTSGCDSGDWTTFPSGSIALVDLNINIRNNCSAFQRALRAQSANASAVIFRALNDSKRLVGPRMLDFPWHKTSTPGTLIPVLMMSQTIGDILFSSTIPFLMNLKINSIVQLEMTSNIYCTASQPGVTETVVVGASIDSAKNSPGVNSNGSGFACLLEIVKAWSKSGFTTTNNFVFAFWNAGTLGSLGSSHYLDTLREAGSIGSVKAYIDLNSLGSTNGDFFLSQPFSNSVLGYESGHLGTFFDLNSRRRYETKSNGVLDLSDVSVFFANSIPSIGVTSGTYAYSTDMYNDGHTIRNVPYSPCDNLPCDTLPNTSIKQFLLVSDDISLVLGKLSQRNITRVLGHPW